MTKKKPPEKDYTGLKNFDKRSVKIEDLFNAQKKVLWEHLRRHREAMFTGETGWDAGMARLAKELSQAIQGLGNMFMRIEEKAKVASDAMTTEEKIAAVVDMIRAEGRINQQRYLKALRTLDYELSQNPQGTRRLAGLGAVPERQESGDS